ncbi:uncharacterized protein EDB91DRAFT_879746 [Suillus paluster]|uniref:uncharacterized protein n=1 Tax=Suillus paluster TaxID=48578 RepID=UPI001B86C1D7|nr:uncharacterized protein EDB91DRAFT_879746 [Suillus paluster]KAG1748452.1 hypothetical protein EDB91DRAFT_879746 [Suillus paluster]
MRFSFLLAVVTALTTSMSVNACITEYGVCGPKNPSSCCKGLTCKLGVSMSRSLCIRDSFNPMTDPLCLVLAIDLRGHRVLSLTLSQ